MARHADAASLPYRDAGLDDTFLMAILGEVPDPAARIASVARVLRRGGLDPFDARPTGRNPAAL